MTPREILLAGVVRRKRRQAVMHTVFGVIFALGADFGKIIAWTTIAVFTARYWGVPI